LRVARKFRPDRVDPDARAETITEPSEQSAVEAPDVEDARAVGDPASGLANAPVLK
jgi:hypothetical protein